MDSFTTYSDLPLEPLALDTPPLMYYRSAPSSPREGVDGIEGRGGGGRTNPPSSPIWDRLNSSSSPAGSRPIQEPVDVQAAGKHRPNEPLPTPPKKWSSTSSMLPSSPRRKKTGPPSPSSATPISSPRKRSSIVKQSFFGVFIKSVPSNPPSASSSSSPDRPGKGAGRILRRRESSLQSDTSAANPVYLTNGSPTSPVLRRNPSKAILNNSHNQSRTAPVDPTPPPVPLPFKNLCEDVELGPVTEERTQNWVNSEALATLPLAPYYGVERSPSSINPVVYGQRTDLPPLPISDLLPGFENDNYNINHIDTGNNETENNLMNSTSLPMPSTALENSNYTRGLHGNRNDKAGSCDPSSMLSPFSFHADDAPLDSEHWQVNNERLEQSTHSETSQLPLPYEQIPLTLPQLTPLIIPSMDPHHASSQPSHQPPTILNPIVSETPVQRIGEVISGSHPASVLQNRSLPFVSGSNPASIASSSAFPLDLGGVDGHREDREPSSSSEDRLLTRHGDEGDETLLTNSKFAVNPEMDSGSSLAPQEEQSMRTIPGVSEVVQGNNKPSPSEGHPIQDVQPATSLLISPPAAAAIATAAVDVIPAAPSSSDLGSVHNLREEMSQQGPPTRSESELFSQQHGGEDPPTHASFSNNRSDVSAPLTDIVMEGPSVENHGGDPTAMSKKDDSSLYQNVLLEDGQSGVAAKEDMFSEHTNARATAAELESQDSFGGSPYSSKNTMNSFREAKAPPPPPPPTEPLSNRNPLTASGSSGNWPKRRESLLPSQTKTQPSDLGSLDMMSGLTSSLNSSTSSVKPTTLITPPLSPPLTLSDDHLPGIQFHQLNGQPDWFGQNTVPVSNGPRVTAANLPAEKDYGSEPKRKAQESTTRSLGNHAPPPVPSKSQSRVPQIISPPVGDPRHRKDSSNTVIARQRTFTARKRSLLETALAKYPLVLTHLVRHLDYQDSIALRLSSKTLQRCFEDTWVDIALQRYLGPYGYLSIEAMSVVSLTSSVRTSSGGVRKVVEPITLEIRDLDAFLIGTRYALHDHAYFARKFSEGNLSVGTIRMLRASTRAWNRVILRIRSQEELSSPFLIQGSHLPQQLQQQQQQQQQYQQPKQYQHQSPIRSPKSSRSNIASVYKTGRAPQLRVWVPLSRQNQSSNWMGDEEVIECEREVWRSGVWNHLKKGDIVHNIAMGDFGNDGKLIFDGKFLRDFMFLYDPVGHLPSWLNMMVFPPAFFHNVIACSTNNPVFFLSLSAFSVQIRSTLKLCDEKIPVSSPQGEYVVKKFVYRGHFQIEKGGMVCGLMVSPGGAGGDRGSEGGEHDRIHEDWTGIVTVEAEGTMEHANALVRRSASTALTPWRIIRENCRPGDLWLRPVFEED